MTEAILLDFGNVVFKDKPQEEWLGPKGQLKVSPDLWEKAKLGQIDDSVAFEDIARNYNVGEETVKQWLFSRREPNQELLELLSQLMPGIKKAVINNGLKTLFRGYFQRNSHLNDEFDLLINSAEEGVTKPDPKIYLIACERLGVKPEECIFIDDDLGNLKGAEDVGMHDIHYSEVEALRKELKGLGLLD